MNDLIISHMDAKVLQHLEGYADDPVELRAELSAYMKKLGIVPMEHTVAVLEYLFRHRSHPTAEEIYEYLRPRLRSITRTTVNSTLEILARQGAIQIVHVDTYDTRYDRDTTPHAHLICACCGAIEDIPLASNLSNMLAIPQGSTIDDIQLMCLGLCAKCNGSKVVN